MAGKVPLPTLREMRAGVLVAGAALLVFATLGVIGEFTSSARTVVPVLVAAPLFFLAAYGMPLSLHLALYALSAVALCALWPLGLSP